MDGLIDQLCAYIRAADLAARFSLAAFPRLVYADYVEAHGEPDRALAIRLHVRLEERGYPILMPPERSPAPWMKSVSPSPALHSGSYRRLCRLWRQHQRQWLGQYPSVLRHHIRFRAGLPWRYVGPAVRLQHVQMSRELSLIRSWRLVDPPTPESIHAFGAIFRDSHTIEITGPAWRELLPTWLKSGAIPPSVVRLGVINGAMSAEAIPALLTQAFPRLRELDISGNALGPEAVANLWVGLRDWPVVDLNISRNAIGEGFRLFLEPGPRKLRHLDCAGNHAEQAGTVVMGNSTCLRQLSSINWMGNSLGPPGAEAIAHWPAPGLYDLDISSNHTGATGARYLGQSEWIKNLRRLNLAENNLREEGIGCLAPFLGRFLRTLILDSNLLEANSGHSLSASPARESMINLELSRNRLGNQGWQFLAEKPWPRLRHIGLMLNDIGPDAPPPSREHFPRLTRIKLARPREDDPMAP